MVKKEFKKSSFGRFRRPLADKSEGKEKKGEIELGEIPFVGGLLKGLEKFIDLAEKVEAAGGEIRKEGEIKGLGSRREAKGIYGFSIRTGIGGKPKGDILTLEAHSASSGQAGNDAKEILLPAKVDFTDREISF